MHPDGRIARRAIVGRGWPGLAPEAEPDGPFDLVVVVPSAEDVRAPEWLEGAVRESARVTRDGIVCVLGGARFRARMRRRLENHGLVAAHTLVVLPRHGPPRVLVPPRAATVRYALENFSYAGRVMRRAFALLGPAAEALPNGALIARSPSARPFFHWLDELAGDGPSDVIAGQGSPESVFLMRFGAAQPTTVAKISYAAPATPLERLGGAARAAGARVPEEIASRTEGARHVSLQTAVPGRRAAALLGERPQDTAAVIERVAGWLERWHGATAVEGRLTADVLAAAVLEPAEEVAAGLDGYLAELRARCAAVEGSAVSLVASHNDLTMANVLVGLDGEIGIVDWDKAEEQSLPLRDLYYAVADARAGTSRYADRAAAFRECFGRGGAHELETATLERRVAAAAGVDARLADLCFDACWLHHARNELRARTRPAPFLAILRTLAAQRSAYTRRLLP